MVQPSQEKSVKEIILRILENYPDGIRSYDLLKKIRETLTKLSTKTYEKYVAQLNDEQSLERIPDPTDHRAKLIRPIPEYSRRELRLLETGRRVREIIDSTPPRPWENLSGHERFEAQFEEWTIHAKPRLEADLGKLTTEQLRLHFLEERARYDPAGDLVLAAYDLFIQNDQHMLKKYPGKNPLDIFIGPTTESDAQGKPIRGIEILHRDEVDRLRRDSSSLNLIRQVDQRNPILSELLKKEGIFLFENSETNPAKFHPPQTGST
jgi:HEPN domain-containing protein